jgi:hypothetical protein
VDGGFCDWRLIYVYSGNTWTCEIMPKHLLIQIQITFLLDMRQRNIEFHDSKICSEAFNRRTKFLNEREGSFFPFM